jgi:Icc-related predicted phosphoesterase
MKVLHYSDKGVQNILELYKQADIFITTGDLRYSDFAGIKTYEHKIPSFGVYGNHDDGCDYLETNKIMDVHNKVVELNNIKIGGFLGCPKYNSREMQFTEQQAEEFANTFPYVDILILHAGPKGLLDDDGDEVHQGSSAIRRYVDEKQPKFIFCGHQYSDDYMEYNGTKIYRTYGARFIDIDIF